MQDTALQTVLCQHCGREYKQKKFPKITDMMKRHYDVCPYCSEYNGDSFETSFFNVPINDYIDDGK